MSRYFKQHVVCLNMRYPPKKMLNHHLHNLHTTTNSVLGGDLYIYMCKCIYLHPYIYICKCMWIYIYIYCEWLRAYSTLAAPLLLTRRSSAAFSRATHAGLHGSKAEARDCLSGPSATSMMSPWLCSKTGRPRPNQWLQDKIGIPPYPHLG